MKTTINPNILLAAVLLVAGGAASAAPPQAGAQAEPDSIITIQNGVLLRGGGPLAQGPATLGNVVAALRQIHPDVNIAVEPGLNQIMIGDVVVHGTEPDLDLEAFSIASGGKFVCERRFSPLSPAPLPGAPPQAVLLIVKTNQPPPPPKPEIKIESFNLSGFIQTKTQSTNDQERRKVIEESVDKLQNIIENILISDLGETLQPKFHYYGDADLLIVTGSDRAVEVARKVISSLPGEEYLNNPANALIDLPGLNYKKAMQNERKAMENVKKMLQQMQPPPQPSPP